MLKHVKRLVQHATSQSGGFNPDAQLNATSSPGGTPGSSGGVQQHYPMRQGSGAEALPRPPTMPNSQGNGLARRKSYGETQAETVRVQEQQRWAQWQQQSAPPPAPYLQPQPSQYDPSYQQPQQALPQAYQPSATYQPPPRHSAWHGAPADYGMVNGPSQALTAPAGYLAPGAAPLPDPTVASADNAMELLMHARPAELHLHRPALVASSSPALTMQLDTLREPLKLLAGLQNPAYLGVQLCQFSPPTGQALADLRASLKFAFDDCKSFDFTAYMPPNTHCSAEQVKQFLSDIRNIIG
jgi:hypothetical protein